jgi:hypothetical protein
MECDVFSIFSFGIRGAQAPAILQLNSGSEGGRLLGAPSPPLCPV